MERAHKIKTNPGNSNVLKAESLPFGIAVISEDIKIKHRDILHI